jgi:hypothetical protein
MSSISQVLYHSAINSTINFLDIQDMGGYALLNAGCRSERKRAAIKARGQKQRHPVAERS